MSFELVGNLILKESTQDVSASFKKREFVIEVANEKNNEWNDFIKFQLTQDRCAAIDSIDNGDKIKVTFNIRGRKWEKDGKVNYFSNLEAWRVEKADGTSSPSNEMAQTAPSSLSAESADDDLPF